MEIKIIAAILLVFRVVAVSFLGFVLRKQLKLLKETRTDYGTLRWILIVLVGITLLGNAVPIVIDVFTLIADVKRANPSPLGVMYGLSNAVTAMITAIGWMVLYKSIDTERAAHVKEHDELVADNKVLTKDNKALKKR